MNNWWREPEKWWEYLKADDDDDTAAIIPPGRGDFEQIIQDRLAPVFDAARERALVALTEGDQFDEAGLRDELIALFLPVLTNAVIFAVDEMGDKLALGFDIDDIQGEARVWALQRAEILADQLIKTTRGLLSELTPEEVESALERAFGAVRREVIGASETTDAMSAGALLFQRLAAALDVFVDLIWFTRKDELVCDICRPLHNTGQAVWSLKFPNGPRAHVKCRCGLRAEVRRRELKGLLSKIKGKVKGKKGKGKKKGPGRGWWGPDKGGTHGAESAKKKGSKRGAGSAKKEGKPTGGGGASGGSASPADERRTRHDERVGLATDHEKRRIAGRVTSGSSSKDERATDVHGRPPKGEWDFTYAEGDENLAGAASAISKETGIEEKAVARMLDRWSATSNDNNYAALHTQEMAAELFGVELSPWQKKKLGDTLDKRLKKPDAYHGLLEFERQGIGGSVGDYISGMPYDSHNDATKAVLRSMHQNTQDVFRDAGYKPGDTVTVFRGVGKNAAARSGKRGKLGSTQEYRTNALESWSLDRNVAQVFSNDNEGQVFSAKVPVERILSMSKTGFGKLKEWEVVVIAGQEPDEYRVVYDERNAKGWWED